MPIVAQFGNTAPLHDVDPSLVEHLTSVEFPEGITLDGAFTDVTDPNGLWLAHSAAAPSWVACSDPDLQDRLAAHYGCPILTVPGIND